MSTNRPMPVAIRCEASQRIGMGHVMRCLSLALALRKERCAVSFLMRETDGQVAALLHEQGIEIVNLEGQSGPMLPAADRQATAEAVERAGGTCVVVDHYGAGADYLGFLAERVRVAVIDDLADRDLTAASWVLNPNPGADSLAYRTRPGCVCAFGPSYALLRPSFLAAAHSHGDRRFSKEDARVLITFGQGDTAGVTAEAIHALASVPRQLEIVCILGPHGVTSGSVQKMAAEQPHKIRILGEVHDMANWMKWADLSINAGGSTCWELCCLGVPMAIVVLSADQRLISAGLGRHGCAIPIGEWAPGIRLSGLARTVEMLLADADRRSDMSRRGRELVDGCGAGRAARSLIETMEHRYAA